MPSSQKRRLQVESLENRLPMAGNVNAYVHQGTLHIEGDDLNNIISVESYRPGIIQVRGFSDSFGAPTAVNQGDNAIRLFFDVNGDVVIHMKRGNDAVRVTNLVVNRNLLIDMDGGADQLITGRAGAAAQYGFTGSGPLYVNGELEIDMGGDSDAMFQSDLHVGGPSEIVLGDGNDVLTIQRPAGTGINVDYFSDLDLFGGIGFDTVNITGLISRSVNVEDSGNRLDFNLNSADVFGNLHITTRDDADSVRILNTNVRGNIGVDLSANNDFFQFIGIAQDIGFHGGDGNDTVLISAAVDELILELESGSDTLLLNGLSARLINVHGNDGDDVFEVRNVRAQVAEFYGDKGSDTYREPALVPNEIRQLRLFTIERRQTV